MKNSMQNKKANSRGAIWRADLLRVLNIMGEIDNSVAQLLGYQRQRDQELFKISLTVSKATESPNNVDNIHHQNAVENHSTQFAVKDKDIAFLVVVHQKLTLEVEVASKALVDGSVLSSLLGKNLPPPKLSLLSPPNRQAAFLHQNMRSMHYGRKLDTSELVKQFARLSFSHRWPFLERKCWNSSKALIIDIGLESLPLREDLLLLAEKAHRLSAGRLKILARGEDGTWFIRQDTYQASWHHSQESEVYSSTHWLLAGDLGNYDRAQANDWLRILNKHYKNGGTANVLIGYSSERWSRRLPRGIKAVTWEHGSRLRMTRAESQMIQYVNKSHVDTLLSATSIAVRVEPSLLRALRLILGYKTSVELAVWNHIHVERCELGMQVHARHLNEYRDHLKSINIKDQQQLVECIANHHQGLSWLIRMEEAALAETLAGVEADANEAWALAVRTLKKEPDKKIAKELTAYLGRLGHRSHPKVWATVPNLEEAYVIGRRDALLKGDPLPIGISGKTLERYGLGDILPSRQMWVVNDHGWIEIRAEEPNTPDCHVLFSSLETRGFELKSQNSPKFWISAGDLPVRLGKAESGAGPWVITTASIKATIGEVRRPSWALEWYSDHTETYVLAPSPIGDKVKLPWTPMHVKDELAWSPSDKGFHSTNKLLCENLSIGADPQFGLYLLLMVGPVLQRMRWIEPGWFLMGSLVTEYGHKPSEGPRHKVNLSKGFWMADTACSQELWEEVMEGDELPHREDKQNPVKRVSWSDVQVFLQKIETIFPGVNADLPTEAEWEYACRAGTEKPFHWGSRITPIRANYDYRKSYMNGPIASMYGHTKPVRNFEPNQFGLFQMHGNVEEWCADGAREYTENEETDPIGPSNEFRVAKGGSWNDPPEMLRAASRCQRRQDGRLARSGFRFILR